MPALQAQSPEFKTQSHQKKTKNKNTQQRQAWWYTSIIPAFRRLGL
jgi:hypothetical protein